MKKEMLINTIEGKECRIAVVEDGRLEELYAERASSASHVGNIYKAKVTNVEPSLQAAFVDFGLGRNGFLHVSDVHPQYFPKGAKENEVVGQKRSHHDRPPIQACLRRGQEVVVQVTKEGIGTKGPTLTTYLSIPGRLLVMMPGMSRLGVSRKIEDEQARAQARAALEDLKPPADMGFIIRTAGIDHSKRDLQSDLNYLLRLWGSVKKHIKSAKTPAEIYQESDLITRTIRDVYNKDIQRIICDSREVAVKVREFLDMAVPRCQSQVELYVGKEGLFQEFGLESEMEKVFSRRVELECGGSLVIDQTEALVAIDVNSGRFREHSDAETTALKMNIEAADEVARQLRLRDMGGVIIIDFIDMREEKHRRAVEKVMREAVRKDRAKTKLLRMSSLGIVEMTRQRMRPSLKDSLYRRCTTCAGMGLIKSEESVALIAMRAIQRALAQDDIVKVEVETTPDVAHHLFNHNRGQLEQIEHDTGKRIILHCNHNLTGEELKITCTNSRGAVTHYEPAKPSQNQQKQIQTVPIETPAGRKPQLDEALEAEAMEMPADEGADEPAAEMQAASTAETPAEQAAPAAVQAGQPQQVQQQFGEGGQRKRRRGRRGGRKHRRKDQGGGQPPQPQQGGHAPAAASEPSRPAEAHEPVLATVEIPPQPAAEPQPPREQPAPAQAEQQIPQTQGQPDQRKKSRHRGHRGGKKHHKKNHGPGGGQPPQQSQAQQPPRPSGEPPSPQSE